MPRSLSLSAHGQQQARQALYRLSLTQKALAEERGVASWSTVSRFFNGKSIDRLIFQDICHILNLNWQTVIQPPPDALPLPPNLALSPILPPRCTPFSNPTPSLLATPSLPEFSSASHGLSFKRNICLRFSEG
ncbi:MAG: helix-turn-helix transcriptional regulator [Cyanobacteria bacterium P01_D01_bin.14]